MEFVVVGVDEKDGVESRIKRQWSVAAYSVL